MAGRNRPNKEKDLAYEEMVGFENQIRKTNPEIFEVRYGVPSWQGLGRVKYKKRGGELKTILFESIEDCAAKLKILLSEI